MIAAASAHLPIMRCFPGCAILFQNRVRRPAGLHQAAIGHETGKGCHMPLTGVRVVELAQIIAGPVVGQVLGELGADVIKVERPEGDESRRWTPPVWFGAAPTFHGVNRSKRSVSLDLTQEDGRARLMKLVRGADVFVQNLRPRRHGEDSASTRKRCSARTAPRLLRHGRIRPQGAETARPRLRGPVPGILRPDGQYWRPRRRPDAYGGGGLRPRHGPLDGARGRLPGCASGSGRAGESWSTPRCSKRPCSC